jgi:hypothetical protein
VPHVNPQADGPVQVVNPDGSNVGGGTSNTEGTPGSAAPAKANQVGGTDGTNLRAVATDAAGVVQVDLAGIPTTDVLSVDSRLTGTWGYQAGTSGTESTDLSAKKVLAIFASAPTSGNGSVAINGGDSIVVPAGKSVNIEPRGTLVAPSIVFTGTDAYFIETVA